MRTEARFPHLQADRGHYESFYLKAAAPEGGRALWIRQTIHRRPGQPATCAIWLTWFDSEHPPAALKQQHAEGAMEFPDDVYPHIGVVHPSGTHSEHHDGTSDRYKRIPNAPGDEAGQGWLDSKATRENYPEAERAADDPKRRAPRQSVYFAIGQSNIDPSSQATIDGVAHEMHENPSWRAELQGRASADGDAASNFALSRERSASVKSTLEGDGIPSSRIVVQNVGEEGGYKGHYWKAKDNDTTARRVDIDLVAGTDQQAASHEAGHMFGLGDEYPGKGEAPGGAYDADYMKLISENSELPAEGGPSQGKAKTGSIMSEGMEVKNWHYAPFVAALKQITGSNDWTV